MDGEGPVLILTEGPEVGASSLNVSGARSVKFAPAVVEPACQQARTFKFIAVTSILISVTCDRLLTGYHRFRASITIWLVASNEWSLLKLDATVRHDSLLRLQAHVL